MKIKRLKASIIKDTRGDKTIQISLTTDFGDFISSSPNGKSKGEYEMKSWRGRIESYVQAVNNYPIYDIEINKFDDLSLVEDIFIKRVGGNTMIALEYAFLKALATKDDKEIWQLINNNLRNPRFPMPVGNAIGGGAHSNGKKPDFQEFHFIPEAGSFEDAVKINKRARENCKTILKNLDSGFKEKTNDENAWQTTFDNEQVIEIMQDVKENMIDEFGCKMHIGIDVAASEFFSNKNKNYTYKNKKENLKRQEQINKIIKIANEIFYIEDPLEQDDFSGFSEIKNKTKSLIVGDDLTATNYNRITAACKKSSINAVIIKPNQIGSLMEVKKIVWFCMENKIKTIFSHRSGETSEDILADLAFGFQADFIKTGICGKGRDEKLNRMIEIERSLG